METYKFITNINCKGCKTAVTPFLNRATKITRLDVDIDHPDKILTIEGENIDKNEVISLIISAGYDIKYLE